MAIHPQREQAIRRCLDGGEPPLQVAAVVGVAASTLRGWLRLARLERELAALRGEREAQQQRQEQLVAELQQAAAALAELKQLLDRDGGLKRLWSRLAVDLGQRFDGIIVAKRMGRQWVCGVAAFAAARR